MQYSNTIKIFLNDQNIFLVLGAFGQTAEGCWSGRSKTPQGLTKKAYGVCLFGCLCGKNLATFSWIFVQPPPDQGAAVSANIACEALNWNALPTFVVKIIFTMQFDLWPSGEWLKWNPKPIWFKDPPFCKAFLSKFWKIAKWQIDSDLNWPELSYLLLIFGAVSTFARISGFF